MANTTLTADIVLKEAHRVFENNTPILQSLRRTYDDSYDAYGAKAGDTIRIKTPQRYYVSTGKTITVQDNTENVVSLARTTQKNIGMKFSSKELSLDIVEFSSLYISPAINSLCSEVENDIATTMYQSTYNATTLPTDSLDRDDVLDAGVLLDNHSCPRDNNRHLVVNPAGQADLVSDLVGLFQQATAIGKQYMSGQMGTALGFNMSMSQNLASHTTGGYNGAYVVTSIPTEGSDDLVIKTGTGTMTVGDVFTVAAVNSVNRVTGNSTGRVACWVVTTAYSGGAGTVVVDPDFRASATDAYRTIDALPQADAATTEIGTASTAYPQNLAYHGESTAFGSCALELPGNSNFESQQKNNNVSIRLIKFYDGINDDSYYRFDILYGQVVVVPEWICRIYGL